MSTFAACDFEPDGMLSSFLSTALPLTLISWFFLFISFFLSPVTVKGIGRLCGKNDDKDEDDETEEILIYETTSSGTITFDE